MKTYHTFVDIKRPKSIKVTLLSVIKFKNVPTKHREI